MLDASYTEMECIRGKKKIPLMPIKGKFTNSSTNYEYIHIPLVLECG